jgi:hypothetical protein
MPLPSSGAISFANVNVELGLISTAQISLNDASVRTLFQVPSGAIAMSNGYGKSNRVSLSTSISANSTSQTVNIASLPGYVAGSSDVTITINSNIYVYSTATNIPGLLITGGTAGDTSTLINNGFILGMGGAGRTVASNVYTPATAGGDALRLERNLTIVNDGYIAGGGGGGGGGSGGGGGAGGGAGGNTFQNATAQAGGGAGGAIGLAGSAGQITVQGAPPNFRRFGGGGGGGRILPGTGGAGGNVTTTSQVAGSGGGSGGGGGATWIQQSGATVVDLRGGAGGSANAAGGVLTGGGGGGGWGASGGDANSAVGGRAIALNGFTATVSGSGATYGAIS